jgi:ankyrin repeat protein
MEFVLRYSAADLCTTNDQGESCLVVAVQHGNVAFLDAIHKLLQQKKTDEQEELALQEVGQLPLREQVRAMVQMKNARGQTTLMAAIRPFSFASCANVPMVRVRTLFIPPFTATSRLALISTGDVKQVSKLLELGVGVNEAELETGNTALFYAATTNSIPLCEYSSSLYFLTVCRALCW